MAKTAVVTADQLNEEVRQSDRVGELRVDGDTSFVGIDEAIERLEACRETAHDIWVSVHIITEPGQRYPNDRTSEDENE